jgi:hypothetical protein
MEEQPGVMDFALGGDTGKVHPSEPRFQVTRQYLLPVRSSSVFVLGRSFVDPPPVFAESLAGVFLWGYFFKRARHLAWKRT